MAQELPELPQHAAEQLVEYVYTASPSDKVQYKHWYTADQMRAYATAHAASLEAEVERLRYALQDIADMTYDKWTNGARAGDIAIQVLSHPGDRDG